MNKNYPVDELHRLLTAAQNVLVVLPRASTFDQVAAALALYLSLNKAEKNASVVSPEQMRVEFSHLVGVDKITDKVSTNELTMMVNVPIENIEKVTSNDESGKLNLTIKPKAGTPPIKQENIVFTNVGNGSVDLVLVLEARRREDLGAIYQDNENLFKDQPVVNISRFEKVEQFGKMNLVDPKAPASSEIITALLEILNLPVDEDICSNLLLGLKDSTQSFQIPATTADTFEAAAFCVRNGGLVKQTPPAKKDEGGNSGEPEVQPSPDWYEPKIYKGSTLT